MERDASKLRLVRLVRWLKIIRSPKELARHTVEKTILICVIPRTEMHRFSGGNITQIECKSFNSIHCWGSGTHTAWIYRRLLSVGEWAKELDEVAQRDLELNVRNIPIRSAGFYKANCLQSYDERFQKSFPFFRNLFLFPSHRRFFRSMLYYGTCPTQTAWL